MFTTISAITANASDYIDKDESFRHAKDDNDTSNSNKWKEILEISSI